MPTTASGFDRALELIEVKYNDPDEPKWDVVLTDVMYPKGGDRCMSSEGQFLAERQGAMPYGPVIALHALQTGVKKIGVITSGNHHSDPFVFAFDSLRGFELGGSKVICTNRCDTYLEKSTCGFVEHPSNWGSPESKEFDLRCEAGEIVPVKDWGKLLDQLLDESQSG
jgi:hypothetical protein